METFYEFIVITEINVITEFTYWKLNKSVQI